MNTPVIGFAGMTHLGLVSGVCAGEKGFEVVCFDLEEARARELARGRLPVSEPGLDELVRRNTERLLFTAMPTELAACDIIYIAADVPTDDQGRSDLAPIETLLAAVRSAAHNECILVILSQVPPGFTRRKQDDGGVLYYQVETLAFGTAVERALHPERHIVGCADPAQPLPRSYAAFLAADRCPVLTMRYESAELAKVSINLCLAATVSTANTLAEVCEKIGADWAEIAPALRLDRRIGPHAYLTAGLGIAGGHLERDLATVCSLATRHGTDAGVVEAIIANSRHRRAWAADVIAAELLNKNPEAVVAVWGIAYKENTHSIEGSVSLATIARFGDTLFRLHDPVVSPSVVRHPNATVAPHAVEALSGADALMILTPWPQYREISPAEIARIMRGRLVLDPYQVIDQHAGAAAGLRVLTLGRAC